MTTAQLRNAAEEAAAKLDWNRAADLMDQAIAQYPMRSALADLDKAKMASRAASWRAMTA